MAKRKHKQSAEKHSGNGVAEPADADQASAAEPNQADAAESGGDESDEQVVAEEVEELDEAHGEEPELEVARREAAENYDRFLRTRAELDNVLRRHQRERAEAIKYAVEPLARDLLATVDDLERALEHAGGENGEDGDNGEGLVTGVEMVLKGLLVVLERHGIERVEATGKPFDPSEHEAVVTVETDEVEPNTVVTQHRPGFRLHDRLLRAAMVAVSKAPEGAEQGDKGDN